MLLCFMLNNKEGKKSTSTVDQTQQSGKSNQLEQTGIINTNRSGDI